MIINQYEIEKYLAATAKRADLRIVWTDVKADGSPAEVATDGKNVFLPRITTHTTQEQAEDIIGYVAHEAGHVEYSDFEFLKSVGAMPEHSLLGAIANCVEDDGIDAINSREYFGDRLIRNENTHRIVSGIVEKYGEIKAAYGGELPKPLEALGALMTWKLDLCGDYYSNAPLHIDGLEASLGKDGKGYLEKLRKGTYADKLRAIRVDETKGRTEKAYKVARDIFEQVFDQDPEKEEERCKQLMKEKKGGDGDGDRVGKGKGDKDSAKGKANMGRGKIADLETEFQEFDYRPYMEDQHDEFMEHKVVSKGSHIRYEGYKHRSGDNYTPTRLEDTIIIDYPANKSNYSRITTNVDSADRARHSEYYGSMEDHNSEGFANKVRMLLQIRSKGKTQYGVKKGKLHQGNVYRVILKDAPGYNQRVFKKTVETDILDTAVLVLGDISGSMSGTKHGHQIVGFRHLNNALGNALHIPLCLMGFTEQENRNAMFIWRKFDDKMLGEEKLTRRMVHSAAYMHQNCDGDSILYAYHVLKQRKEKRKVLIVTSDGSPASSKGGDIYGYTKKVIEQIEKDKHVDIIAIGIQDRNVEALYKTFKTIKAAHEIEPALLSIIERKII